MTSKFENALPKATDYMSGAREALDRLALRNKNLNQGFELPKTQSTFEVGKWKSTVQDRKPYEEMSTPGIAEYESGGYQNRTSDSTVPDRYQQPGLASMSGKYEDPPSFGDSNKATNNIPDNAQEGMFYPTSESATNTIGGNIGENTGQSQPENLVPNPQDFGKDSIPNAPDSTESRESFDAYQRAQQSANQHRLTSNQTEQPQQTQRDEYDPQKLADPAHNTEEFKYDHQKAKPYEFDYKSIMGTIKSSNFANQPFDFGGTANYLNDMYNDSQSSQLKQRNQEADGFNYRNPFSAMQRRNPASMNRANHFMKGKMGQVRQKRGGQRPSSNWGDFMGKMKSKTSFNFDANRGN